MIYVASRIGTELERMIDAILTVHFVTPALWLTATIVYHAFMGVLVCAINILIALLLLPDFMEMPFVILFHFSSML